MAVLRKPCKSQGFRVEKGRMASDVASRRPGSGWCAQRLSCRYAGGRLAVVSVRAAPTVLVVAAALAGGAPAAVAGPVADAAAAPKPGQYCTKAKEAKYRRYGLTCAKRDKRGRLHLKRL